MRGSSEGSALPNAVSSDSLTGAARTHTSFNEPTHPHDLHAARRRFAAAHDAHSTDAIGDEIPAELAEAARAVNVAEGQSGESWALPCSPPTRVWKSRRSWTTRFAVWLACDEGRTACRHAKVAPATCLAVAQAKAQLADSATGRSVTASARTIGRLAAKLIGREKEFSHDTVGAARRVFEAGGWAVEVAQGRYLTAAERLLAWAHHGCRQTRAASVWALIEPTQTADVPYLPPRSFTPRKGSTCRKSPTRARKRTPAPFGRSPDQPRPLAAQRTAAQLVQRIPSLGEHHIGAIVDVIIECADYNRWTGRDLQELMNQAARRQSIDWPARIDKPAAFLRHRFQTLTAELSGPSPSQVAAEHANRVRIEQAARREAQRASADQVASADTRRSALAEFRAVVAAKRAARGR